MKHMVLWSFKRALNKAYKDKKKKRNKLPNNWIFSNQTDNIYSLRVVPKYFRKFQSLSE